MSDNRITREKAFHDHRFGDGDADRKPARKYYSVLNKAGTHYRKLALEACPDAHLLEYGCGFGAQSINWLRGGATVAGIDISSSAIERARNAIKATPYADRADYYEMNAEAMTFDDNSFDIVLGSGILHHLDLHACYSEIARVLKPSGLALFMEPLGHNPIINLYRNLTPNMRTEDEHPLIESDIELARQYFGKVDFTSYNLSTLLAVPFRSTPMFKTVFESLHRLDQSLFRSAFMKKQAWSIVLELRKPRDAELK